ncbi:hypothetical protein [Ruminiclostridium cellobioparum]|uniref:hypothetical protein n=1 Tax=Ruminiclostridium cellobioparum TaxID=29355 RepID=UPI000483BB6C|nr:hypothetical protein [Ruminiclostridium cellobioparum]
MKKIILSMVILFTICSGLPISAEVDRDYIYDVLQQDYGVLVTNTGYAEINYKINRIGDINEVQLYLDYELFNDIQFGYYTLKEKQVATDQVKQFAHEIYKEVTKLYPEEKWQGCYVASFTNIFNQDVTLEFFNWSNFNDNEILKGIQWLPQRDADWELGKWPELEK